MKSALSIRSEIGVDSTDRHIHLCHLPSIGVALLTVNRNIATIAAVRLDKYCALYKHTAASAAGIIYTAVFKRIENGNNGFYNA